jgi:hypothetical protein
MNDTVSENVKRARGIEAALDEARHWDEGFTSSPREYQVLRIVGDEVKTISRHADRASMEAALSEAKMSACINAYLAATKPVTVPAEPTPEMYGAGGVEMFKCDMAAVEPREAVGRIYRAMLAASRPKEDTHAE